MMFNVKKSKTMIFNFTNQYQFTTRLSLNNNNLDVVSDTKLLRTIICDDLKWDKNCIAIIKKLYARMKLLKEVVSFNASYEDCIIIYITFLLNLLEYRFCFLQLNFLITFIGF